MKRFFTVLGFILLALAATLNFGYIGRYSASAKSEQNLSRMPVSMAAGAAFQTSGISLPNVNIYCLTSDNMIYVLTPGQNSFRSVGRVPRANGNLIGIDFRPADAGGTSVYGLTDTGNLLLINVASSSPLDTTVVSSVSPRFAGGFQSLMDFNPVANALRIIGSNDQNFAVVNANGGNLNQTVVQTALAYAMGDVNFGVDPNISAGTYSNNVAGAANTIFYAIDYDLDTFVTIATKNATGSSNTGGGQLQTIGKIVNAAGNTININPTADIDIYTPALNGPNTLVGINNETLFTIDLNQINPALALGATQNVTANTVTLPAAPPADAFIDIAVARFRTYQAEDATVGGGSWVMTNHTGFTGTGFVDFADAVAGGFCEFTINQTGSRTFMFRYSNGSTANRPTTVTLNGASVGTLNFPPTGSFDTWSTTSITINLGTVSGAKVRLTAATAAGGPNLDRADVQ